MMRESIGRILTLTKRNAKEILRDPLSLIFTIGLPLFMEILFYAVFHEMTDQFAIRYLAPGIVVFSQAFLTLFAGLLIAQDRASSFLTRLYVTRARSYEFIFGYVLALLPIAAVQSTLFFLVGGALDPSVFSVGMLWGVLVSLVTSLFFIAAGILFGALCTDRSIGGVASVIITGQSLLSGMWFPTTGMSDGFLIAMKCLPFKNATLVVQNAFLGVADAFYDFLLPLLILLGYAVLVVVGAILAFKKKMRPN